MSLPRPILPGTTYLVTRRCTQRQFLLKPTAQTTQIFTYCLAAAAERTGVLIHAVCVMSNHWHAVVTDPHGRLPDFLAYVHLYVAKCVNASLGRWENLWAAEQTSVVRLSEPPDVLDKIVYVVTNPVTAGLVERAADWPGLLVYLPEHSRDVARPEVFFREAGPMPQTLRLELCIPPAFEHLSPEEYRQLLEKRLAAHDAAVRAELAAAGRSVLGVGGVLAQRHTDRPRTPEPRRELSPRVAARNKWARIEALQRLKGFLRAYREAFVRWRQRLHDVLFPPGTYALRVHAGVLCAPG